jgi:hypothetical protein
MGYNTKFSRDKRVDPFCQQNVLIQVVLNVMGGN